MNLDIWSYSNSFFLILQLDSLFCSLLWLSLYLVSFDSVLFPSWILIFKGISLFLFLNNNTFDIALLNKEKQLTSDIFSVNKKIKHLLIHVFEK